MRYILTWMAIGYIINMIANKKFYLYFNSNKIEHRLFAFDVLLGPLGLVGLFIGWLIVKFDLIDKDE